MVKTQTFTVSIGGVFLFFAISAGSFVWLGPFAAPDLMPFEPGIGWTSGQYHGFAVAAGVGVGVCAATVLVLVRYVLPAPLQSHIVWIPPDFFDGAKSRKQGIKLVQVAVVLLGMMLFIEYGPPRFWGSFTGMSEAEVREKLGEPHRDGDKDGDKETSEYILKWHAGFGSGLFLTFNENGTVVSQERVHSPR